MSLFAHQDRKALRAGRTPYNAAYLLQLKSL
jgi:hypothetical protein